MPSTPPPREGTPAPPSPESPSYKEIAEKARTKPEFAAKLYKHVTVLEKVEIKGKQEDHEPLKTKDEAEIQAILQWIQSR